MQTEMRIKTELAIRWLGRIVAILLAGMVLMFAVGEGPPNPFKCGSGENAMSLAFGIMVVGWIVGCFREGMGGALAIGGLIGFYLINLAVTGRFPGGNFRLTGAVLAMPGALFLISYLLRRKRPCVQ